MSSQDSWAWELNSILACHACTNHVKLPTRVTENSATSIDICVTNLNEDEIFTGVLTSDISDHLPIFAFTNSTYNNHASRAPCYRRIINDFSLEHFRELIVATDWQAVYNESDVNTAFSAFLSRIQNCYDSAFPLRYERSRNKKVRKPWINRHLYNDIKKMQCTTFL